MRTNDLPSLAVFGPPNHDLARHRSVAYIGRTPVKRSSAAKLQAAAIYWKKRGLAKIVAGRNASHKTALRWIKNYGLRSEI
jgi:predicted transcriptional regulator